MLLPPLKPEIGEALAEVLARLPRVRGSFVLIDLLQLMRVVARPLQVADVVRIDRRHLERTDPPLAVA